MAKSSKKAQALRLAQQMGVIHSDDLLANKLPREYLSRLAKEGKLVREDRGYYRVPDYVPGQYESFIVVTRKIPNSVIALLSALRFHNLTTQNPFEVWLAIEHNQWLPKLDYPPIRYVYFSGKGLSEGVEEHEVEGVSIKVFSPAKTVADCFKYRNKIGLDVALEALREGWDQKRFSINELYEYAKICRVHNVIRPYIEALI